MDKESCEEVYARQELIAEASAEDDLDLVQTGHVQQTAGIGMMVVQGDTYV